jgi:hypothetical protein
MTPPGPPAPGDGPAARAMWRRIEAVHAVTYFAPESRHQLVATGLRGFWMGYFAARAAPLGAVGPAVVAATFFNFHPSMVERAIPDAWTYAEPSAVVLARRAGAATALRRLLPSVDEAASDLAALLERVIEGADGSGRPLFSANRGLDAGHDPVERLWQGCTSLREHRGDGHVAALVTHGLDGCEALVLFAASEGIAAELFCDNRGWSARQWEAARSRLQHRGLLERDRPSAAGADLRDAVERTTDRLAAVPFAGLGDEEYLVLTSGLDRMAGAVTGQGVIPFPNPIGLPPPTTV